MMKRKSVFISSLRNTVILWYNGTTIGRRPTCIRAHQKLNIFFTKNQDILNQNRNFDQQLNILSKNENFNQTSKF